MKVLGEDWRTLSDYDVGAKGGYIINLRVIQHHHHRQMTAGPSSWAQWILNEHTNVDDGDPRDIWAPSMLERQLDYSQSSNRYGWSSQELGTVSESLYTPLLFPPVTAVVPETQSTLSKTSHPQRTNSKKAYSQFQHQASIMQLRNQTNQLCPLKSTFH